MITTNLTEYIIVQRGPDTFHLLLRVEPLRDRILRKNGAFCEFSLCLSRACLGKKDGIYI
jgi:hypothetical protein